MRKIEIPTEMYIWMEHFGDPDVFAVDVIKKALVDDRNDC